MNMNRSAAMNPIKERFKELEQEEKRTIEKENQIDDDSKEQEEEELREIGMGDFLTALEFFKQGDPRFQSKEEQEEEERKEGGEPTNDILKLIFKNEIMNALNNTSSS